MYSITTARQDVYKHLAELSVLGPMSLITVNIETLGLQLILLSVTLPLKYRDALPHTEKGLSNWLA
jgi:hypothetical protein